MPNSKLATLGLARALFAFVIGLAASCRGGRPAANQPADAATAAVRDDPCGGARRTLEIQRSPGVVFGSDDAAAQKEAPVWKAPATLALAFEPPSADATRVRTVAVLSNTGSEPIDVFTLAGGEPGFSTNPFGASLEAPERPLPKRFAPEIYPYPQKITLPAGATVRYVVEHCLAAYEVKPGAEVAITWSFEFWNERRAGKATVVLP